MSQLTDAVAGLTEAVNKINTAMNNIVAKVSALEAQNTTAAADAVDQPSLDAITAATATLTSLAGSDPGPQAA